MENIDIETPIPKIRKRKSYHDWKLWINWVNTNPSKEAILKKIWEVKNDCYGFKSRRNSDCAWESLILVLKEEANETT